MNALRAKSRLLSVGTAICAVLSMTFAFVTTPPQIKCDCSQKLASQKSTGGCCAQELTTSSCCSQEGAPSARQCCCSTDETVCDCSVCSCGELNDSAPKPTSQPSFHQVADSDLVGKVPPLRAAWSEKENQRSCFDAHAKLIPTAHQKCVLLSRFDC